MSTRVNAEDVRTVAEVAAIFADPLTGRLPRIVVRPWTSADGCGVCGDLNSSHLYAEVAGEVYCSRCRRAAGSPWPGRSPLLRAGSRREPTMASCT
jgi:hypothetical protein